MTMDACCARFSTQIARCQAEIARLARIMARRADRGLDISKYQAQLREARANLAETRSHQVDHEAAHAGAVAV